MHYNHVIGKNPFDFGKKTLIWHWEWGLISAPWKPLKEASWMHTWLGWTLRVGVRLYDLCHLHLVSGGFVETALYRGHTARSWRHMHAARVVIGTALSCSHEKTKHKWYISSKSLFHSLCQTRPSAYKQ